MANKLLTNAFNSAKDFIWNRTYKDAAKMLIGMGALGFALSSMGQCFAIHINDKIDRKKKNFLLLQETADGAVNIGLYLAITSGIWKLSDKILKHLGIITQDAIDSVKANPKNINHVISGGRIVTTMAASVVSCNIITPIVRNMIAGKIREHVENKHKPENNLNAPKLNTPMTFEKNNIQNNWTSKPIGEMYKNPVASYYSNRGSMRV